MGEYWIAVFLFWVFVVPFIPPFSKLPAGDMMMLCIGGVVLWLVVQTTGLPTTHRFYVPAYGWLMLGAAAYVVYLFSYVFKIND